MFRPFWSFITALLFSFLPLSVKAQESGANLNLDNKQPTRKDSLYIRDYSNMMMFGIYTSVPFMDINMQPVPDSLHSYTSNFKGNYSSVFGFNFGYKVLGVSFGFKLPADPGTIDSLGKSSYKVLGIKIRKKALILSFDIRKYKGFYDAATRNYNTSLPSNTPFIIRPDMAIRNISATGIWNFSWKKYSFSAPITYCDRQVKTRVGFLLKADFSYMNLYADSSLVSARQDSAFGAFSDVKSIDALVFKTGPGMGMNLIFFKRMYCSFNLFLMNNTLIYRYNHEVGKQGNWKGDLNYFLEGGLSVGYSARHFYVGLRAGGENNVVRLSGTKIQTSFGTVCFDLGIRLNAPNFLHRTWHRTATRYLGI